MMNECRWTLAVLLFCTGAYLFWDLLAHYIKPEKHDNDAGIFPDILDFMIDLPFKTVAVFIRGISRIFKIDL